MSRTSLVSTLSGIGTVLALVACEGEPPKYPSASAPPGSATSAEPAAAPAAAQAETPSAGPGATATSRGGECTCPCGAAGKGEGERMGMGMGMHGAAGAASGVSPSGAEASPSAGPAPVTTAPAAGHGDIVGSVTTMPARSAGAAVVYLEDAPVVPGRGLSARVDNRRMSFIPFVTVVAKGAHVVFTNEDPFPHNVFSADNERFNLGMIQQKGAGTHVFKSPGVYSLLCNLHPNMLGYVVVSPSSYFAKADAKGHFIMKDVPAGNYKITAWAPRQQPVTEPVTVKDGEVTANFQLHR